MAGASLQSFRRTVTVDWPRRFDETARRHLLAVAQQTHAHNLQDAAAAGAVPQVEAYANTPGRPVDAVVLPGPIVYRYRYLGFAVRAALAALRENSPARSGAYREGHTLYIDGVAVEGVPERIDPSAEIMISNPVAYARRIEVGRTASGRSFVLQVPNAIYERVAKRILTPRFGAVARFVFGYATLPGAARLKAGLSGHYGTGALRTRSVSRSGRVLAAGTMRVRKREQRAGETVRAPAIFIQPPR